MMTGRIAVLMWEPMTDSPHRKSPNKNDACAKANVGKLDPIALFSMSSKPVGPLKPR